MPTQKEAVEPKPSLAVIAGGGGLPRKLIHACDRKGITPFIIGFEGQTDPSLVDNRYHLWTRLGAAAQIIQTLKAHEIKEIVMIGSIRRPSFDELRPDWKTAHLLTRLGFKALGDDGLLKALKAELQKEGFEIRGVQDFVDDLLSVEGIYTTKSPDEGQWMDIEKGCKLVKLMGRLDVGQACVVQQGIVLGVEAIEGTDKLIARCSDLKRQGDKPTLIKVCKPRQDKSLDLPTIGPDTIKNAAKAGLAGIVVEAGNSLLIDPDKTTELANQLGLYLVGVSLDDEGTLLKRYT